MWTDKFRKVSAEALWLIFLFFLSLGVKAYLLFEFPHVVFTNEADAMGYFAIAKSIINTWGLGDTSIHFPPFYPFVIAITSLFTGEIEIAGRVVSCIMGSLLAFPVYLVGRELYGKRVGLLSAIVAIFLGTFVDLSLQPLSQMTYILLLITGIYLGIILIKSRSLTLHLLLGLTFGAAYLTRPEGLVPFAVVGMTVSIAALNELSLPIRRRVTSIFLMLLGFSVLALPYINYLHNQTGIWTISGKSSAAVIGTDASARLLPGGKTLGEASRGKVGLGDLFPSPEAFLKTYWGNIARFAAIIPDHFPVKYLILAFFGLLFAIKSIFDAEKSLRKTIVLQIFILLACLAAILPVFAFSGIGMAPSYFLPLFYLIILWFARGVAGVEDLFFNFIKKLTGSGFFERIKKWSLLSFSVVFFFSYSSILPVWNEMNSEDFRVYAASDEFFLKDTGKWLKDNTSKDSAIMSRWSNMGFYADRKWVYIPDGEISEVVNYAKEHNVSHIIIDSNAIPRRRPKLGPLLNPSDFEGLSPVYVREEYRI